MYNNIELENLVGIIIYEAPTVAIPLTMVLYIASCWNIELEFPVDYGENLFSLYDLLLIDLAGQWNIELENSVDLRVSPFCLSGWWLAFK